MKNRPAAVIIGVLSAVLAAGATRRVIDWIREEPVVSRAAIERPWSTEQVGALIFESPRTLEPREMLYPPEARAVIETSTTKMHEADGLTVYASYIRFRPDVVFNLEAGAAGTESSMRAVRGTVSLDFRPTETSFFGHRAIAFEAHIVRERGMPLAVHGIMFSPTASVSYQLMLGHRADQAAGQEAWERLLDSAALRGGT